MSTTAVQHERGPRKPKPPRLTNGSSSTNDVRAGGQLALRAHSITQRQLIYRQRHAHQAGGGRSTNIDTNGIKKSMNELVLSPLARHREHLNSSGGPDGNRLSMTLDVGAAGSSTSIGLVASLNNMVPPTRGHYNYETVTHSNNRMAPMVQASMLDQMAPYAPKFDGHTTNVNPHLIRPCSSVTPTIGGAHCVTNPNRFTSSSTIHLNQLHNTSIDRPNHLGHSVQSDESDCSEEIIVDDTDTCHRLQQQQQQYDTSLREAAHDKRPMVVLRSDERELLAGRAHEMASAQRWLSQASNMIQGNPTHQGDQFGAFHYSNLPALHNSGRQASASTFKLSTSGQLAASQSSNSRTAVAPPVEQNHNHHNQHHHQQQQQQQLLLQQEQSAHHRASTSSTSAAGVPTTRVQVAGSAQAMQYDSATSIEQQLKTMDQMMIYNSIFASFLSHFAGSSQQSSSPSDASKNSSLTQSLQANLPTSNIEQARLLNALMMEDGNLSFSLAGRLAASSDTGHRQQELGGWANSDVTSETHKALQASEFRKGSLFKQTSSALADGAIAECDRFNPETLSGAHEGRADNEQGQGSTHKFTRNQDQSAPSSIARRLRKSIGCQPDQSSETSDLAGSSASVQMITERGATDNVTMNDCATEARPPTIWRAFVD
jgi:hypothetical protein